MPTLVLMRHATAEPESFGDDRERALTERGRLEAQAAGRVLSSGRLAAARVLCSPAVRALQTWQQAVAGAGGAMDGLQLVKDERLYLASPGRLLGCLAELEPDQDAIVVAHNPGLSELGSRLARRGSTELRLRLGGGFSPCTAAVLSCPDWLRLEADGAEVLSVHRP